MKPESSVSGGWTDADIVLLNRITIHDLTNLVQIVDGWLQLGEVQEARDALADGVARLADSAGLKACPDVLAAELILASAHARSLGVRWRTNPIAGPIGPISPVARTHLRRFLRACVDMAGTSDRPHIAATPGIGGAIVQCEISGSHDTAAVEQLAALCDTAPAVLADALVAEWHGRGR